MSNKAYKRKIRERDSAVTDAKSGTAFSALALGVTAASIGFAATSVAIGLPALMGVAAGVAGIGAIAAVRELKHTVGPDEQDRRAHENRRQRVAASLVKRIMRI